MFFKEADYLTLKIHNTLTNKKENFIPLEEGKVSIYVCGVTVYDDIHLGHARSIIVFDMVVRYLRHCGYKVTHVTNFTDVDDKIIARANEEGIDPLELSARYIQRYFEDIDALKVRRADAYPKASESMDVIIDMVQDIIEKGFAYVTDEGNVYFSIDKVGDYGRLTKQRLEDMISGQRDVLQDPDKRNPMDFAIWKAVKPGEIAWDSPWGKGRPGWHIECSAMIRNHLGDIIDIHGGGNDLIFPHHENEILQTEAVTGGMLARYWMHNGMLQIQDQKMSKSLGNFLRVSELVKEYDSETIRFYLLNTHYRGPLLFTKSSLEEAKSSLRRLWNLRSELESYRAEGSDDASDIIDESKGRFYEQMDDDFNTRGAISVLFDLARELNRLIASSSLSKRGASEALGFLHEVDNILGFFPENGPNDDTSALIDLLIDVRQELRRRKIFDLSDTIRNRLKEMGIQLEDTAEGVKWKRI